MRDDACLERTAFALVAQAVPAKAAGELHAGLSLRRDLGLDSLGLAKLFVQLGEELGTDPDDLIELMGEQPINTLGDMVALGARIQRAGHAGGGS
jgi:acyl carrier protein